MRNYAIITAISLCALGGSLSAVNAAGVEDVAPQAVAVPMENEADMPRFQPSIAFQSAPVVQPLPAAAEELETSAIAGGEASWYGARFAGRPTASGERFNPTELTAAHRTLPFGTKVRVTHAGSGKSVVVRINDRGPFARDRVIDLSKAAASQIGIVGPGRGEVELALLSS